MDADYVDDLSFCCITWSKLNSPFRESSYVRNKMEQSLHWMVSFKVDKFSYSVDNISFTESDINIPTFHHRKGMISYWEVIDQMKIHCLPQKIKWEFFQAVSVSVLLLGCTTLTQIIRLKEKAWLELYKYAAYWEEYIF